MTDKDTKKVATKATPKAKPTPYVADTTTTYARATRLYIANWRLKAIEKHLDDKPACRDILAMTDKEIWETHPPK